MDLEMLHRKTKTVGSISRIESYAYDNGRFLKNIYQCIGDK